MKAVIFDMDGVLIDATDWHRDALNEALSIFGESINLDEHDLVFNGLPTREKLRILAQQGRIPPGLHETISAIKQDLTLRIAAQRLYPNRTHLIALQKLRDHGFKLAVATNSIRRTTEYMLSLAGVISFFDAIVTNEDVVRAKPAPDIYLEACKQVKVKPSEALVIEDSDYGVNAAKSAGCKVLQIGSPSDLTFGRIEVHALEGKEGSDGASNNSNS